MIKKVATYGVITNKRWPELQIEVIILDEKFAYGSKRYLVTPVAGKGKMWIENVQMTHTFKTSKVIND